jgi:uncharacterized protein (TIGR02271 family)
MDRHQTEPVAGIERTECTLGDEKTPERKGLGANQPVSPSQETLTVQLREDELLAEKRLVQVGVVRIRRRVLTEARMVEVSVTREEMIVERLPVEAIGSRGVEAIAAAEAEPSFAESLRALQLGETLRLPIAEEEIIIQKRPMVTRELLIDKRLVEEVRRFSDTVRREDVRITPVGAEPLKDKDDDTRAPSDTPDTLTSSRFAQDEKTSRTHNTDATWTLELREEELQARTQIVDAGAVEVRTGVVSERESIVLKVSHEETDVEQVAVDHRQADRPIGSGEDILDIPVYGEHVTLRKRPVVTEEITVGKEAVEDVQHVTTIVRREVALVETQGDVRVHGVERSQPETADIHAVRPQVH